MSNQAEYRNLLMVGGNAQSAGKEEINYKSLFYKYILSKWYVYLISLIVFIGLAVFYVSITQSVYEIESKLVIKEREPDYGAGDDWLEENTMFTVVSENVRNEIEVLSSFALMRDVLTGLQIDVRYYWKDKLKTIETYKDFPFYVESFSLNKPEEISFQILPLNQNSFQLIGESPIGTYQFDEDFSNEFGSFCIQKRDEIYLGEESTMHIGFVNLKELTQDYLDNFSVEFSDLKMKSSILRLSLLDVVPERGVAILDRLIERYNELKFRENNELALKTLALIDERLGRISSDLRSVENSLERYKLNNNIASETTSDLGLVLGNVNQLAKEQKDLEIQINVIESMKRDLQNAQQDYSLIPVNLSLVDVKIQDMIKPYNDLVLRRKQLLLTGQPSNPIVLAVNQDLNNLIGSISQALENMSNELQLQLDAKNTQYATFEQRLRSVPRKERQLSDKTRQQEITEDLYVYLLKKREETTLAMVNNFSNSNVVDPPRSSIYPVGPKKKLIVFGSFLAALAFPFILILGIDQIRDSVQTEKELRNALPKANILGIISNYKGKEKQIVLRQRRSLTAEHFRSLRTKLQFHFRAKQKTILVTSSTSTEGKSFVANNLAMSYALAKKKTIIIDFDLHKPDLSVYLEHEIDVGLSDFLLGALNVEEVIHTSSASPNLDYIACGPVPMNPNEMITPEKLNELFEVLKAKYEIIIVDTPPVGIISDALLLNKYVTNSLYIVRSGFTKKEMIEKAKELFDKKLLPNPAVVLNGVKKTELYGYGYSQYKRYAM